MTVRIGVGVAAPTGLCHGTASRTAWARGAPWHQSPNLPRLVLTPFYTVKHCIAVMRVRAYYGAAQNHH
jgi:hypothetical protein